MSTNRIRDLREMSGLSQHEVERKTGIDRSRLSLHECGHAPLAQDEATKVERLLLGTIQTKLRRVNVTPSDFALAVGA